MAKAKLGWKVIALAAEALAAPGWLIAGHQAAEAGHTWGDAHCRSPIATCVSLYSAERSNPVANQRSFAIRE